MLADLIMTDSQPETPGRKNWYHAVGTQIEGMSLEDSLTVAGLNWGVTKQTISLTGSELIIPDYRAVVRDDTNRTLAIVGKRYVEINNHAVAEFGNAILGTDGIAVTAGYFEHGAQVFIQYKIQKDLYIAGDEIETYLLLFARHDGKGGIRAVFTNIRAVCKNTLYMALRSAKRAVSIRHASNYEERMQEAVKVMDAGRKYNNVFAQQADELLKKTVSDSQFEKIMKTLLPMPSEPSRTVEENVKKEWNLMLQAKNASDLENVKGTAWGAYNAFVDHYDHNVNFKGTKREKNERALLNTIENTDKDKALDLIMALA